MPSDERTRAVLDALRPATAGFLASLDLTAEEVGRFLAAQQSTLEGRAARLAAELGPFGAGRIDPVRLARVVHHEREADPLTVERVTRALATLAELTGLQERLFVVSVPRDGSLRDAVAATLTAIGRVFAAARLGQEARAGRGRGHADGLDGLPFARWSKAERGVAPPLVVELAGSDLRAGGLAEFLDGRQKIVLVVEGDCAPAPLVRLISPRTFVLQTGDPARLERFVAWDGPGIAALVPESAARFRHDPAGGPVPWDRLTIDSTPDRAPRKAVGGLSVAQQVEELELLRALEARPLGANGGGSVAAAPADPVEKLASWVLGQADLSDAG